MYGAYEPKALGYPDNLSISSTDTAAPTPTHSSADHHAFRMNAAFPPEDPAKQLAGVYPNDPATALLLDQQNQHHHQHQQQQTQDSSRTQTPSAKRSREDDESDGESEGNAKGDTKDEKRAGRRKIKIEYIEDKSRRHITFSKRKAGIMKKAFELSTLTGTQVLLLVVSETGLVYTFTTPKLQPIVTKPEGKNLIQACLNAPELPDANNQVVQPTPTESNSYMSQPRQAYAANAAQVAPSVIPSATAAGQDAAAAAAAAAAQSMSGADSGFDRKLHSGSPAGVNHATAYLQQYYNGQQAVVAAAAGMPGAYSSNNSMGAYAAAVAGYGSYPGSNNHSQHHSPIAANVAPHTPQPVNGISAAVAAAASSMPTMGSLASYHHQTPGQQQQPLPNFQSSQSQTPTHGLSTPGTPSVSNTSVSAAVAAAVAVANSGHAQGMPSQQHQQQHHVAYMSAANQYWPSTGIHTQQPQQPSQVSSATVAAATAAGAQRPGYSS